jgi:diacylglycerol O-acyltransferase
MQQLTGLDASFLYMETGAQFGHVGSVGLYDASATPAGVLYERVRRSISERLHLLPPFRRRLVEVPLGLDHPYWIEDPDFDLDFHVRHIAVPPPGTDEQLADLVARIHGRPMDRAKPLWEVYVIEGIAHDRVALYIKIHHCTIDGVSGAEMTATLLDVSAEGAKVEPPAQEWRPDALPSQAGLFGRGLAATALRPGRAARFAFQAIRSLAQSPELVPMARAVLGLERAPLVSRLLGRKDDQVDAPPIPQTRAPRTPFNRSITPHRRWAFCSLPLADAKRVKSAYGTTLNDVVLAMSSGALRRYLERKDALPREPLIAMVPVSVRSESEKQTYSNRVSSILTELATDEPDPELRLARIHRAMKAAKRMQQAVPASLLQDFTQFATPNVAGQAARIIARTRIFDRLNPPFNVVISNVPGPRHPLYLGGARMLTYYPVSAVAEGQGLNITVQSYLDQLDFGLIACRDLVPDLWDLIDDLRASSEELTKLAARRAAEAPPAPRPPRGAAAV